MAQAQEIKQRALNGSRNSQLEEWQRHTDRQRHRQIDRGTDTERRVDRQAGEAVAAADRDFFNKKC